MSEDNQRDIAETNFKKNLKLNKEYPAGIWSFAHTNLYNDYFILGPPKDKAGEDPKISKIFSPEQHLIDNHHFTYFGIKTKKVNLSNSERTKIKDKSIIIGSRYRFYVPLFDKNSGFPWVIYADPTMLFLNNPRTLIEKLDPSKTVYVCKHDNYTTKRQTKTLIPSIQYPFNSSVTQFFELLKYLNQYPDHPFERGRQAELNRLKELYSPENFEKFDKLFTQRDLSQDDFIKACLAIFKDKKHYMLRNKQFANEEILEEIYQRWYVNDEMESFDNFDYDRKNWSSFMIFNKEKFKLNWHQLDSYSIEELHQFDWCADEEIGELPLSWNHLVDEQEDISNPNALNFTVDSPGRYKSSGTSKLNQKYININLVQVLVSEFLPKIYEGDTTTDKLKITLDSINKNYKYILDLTPKKLDSICAKLNIENLSPLEVLYTFRDTYTGFALGLLPDLLNVKSDADPEVDGDLSDLTDEIRQTLDKEELTEKFDELVNGRYTPDAEIEHVYDSEFYLQNCYNSKNKIKEMIKTLQQQIKNLTESDKKEIFELTYAYFIGVDSFEDSTIESFNPTNNSLINGEPRCSSIRELTGRII